MAFPVSYNFQRTVSKVYPAQPKPKNRKYDISVPFMPFTVTATITVTEDGGKHKYSATVIHRNTLSAIIVCLVAALFFSNFTVVQFLMFGSVFSVIFYFAVNQFCVSYILKKLHLPKDEVTVLNHHEEWLYDPEKCPACGAKISPAHRVCENCGLRLR